jgi:hypothetical protein
MTLKERQKKQRDLQDALVEAAGNIERAKLLANELEVPFEILGRTYTPLKVVQHGGKFDHEALNNDWEESSDGVEWNGSGPGIPC